MQHITTKSSHQEKGRKVYARASGGCSVRLGWDYALNREENHAAALEKLCERLDWSYDWTASPLKNGGFVWVASRSGLTVTTAGRLGP